MITGYRAMVIMDSLTESEWVTRRDAFLAKYALSPAALTRPVQSLSPSDVGFMVAEEIEREIRKDERE